MRRFQFRLEPALRVRRFREEEAQLELSAAQRRLADEEAIFTAINDDLLKRQQMRAVVQTSVLDIEELSKAVRLEEMQSIRLENQRVEVEKAELEVAEKLIAVKKAHADREVLELLRERRLTEHYQSALAAEQQDIDESSVLRWHRA